MPLVLDRHLLVIAILHIERRRELLTELLDVLRPQIDEKYPLAHCSIHPEVICEGGIRPTIAQRRNEVIDLWRDHAEYLCFVDDDDRVAPDFVAKLLKALEFRPDCVGFKSHRFSDGGYIGEAVYSMRFARRQDYSRSGPIMYSERMPCHLTPVRMDLIQQVRFDPRLNMSEDIEFASRLRPLLKTEVFVDDYLYEYRLSSQGSESTKRWLDDEANKRRVRMDRNT